MRKYLLIVLGTALIMVLYTTGVFAKDTWWATAKKEKGVFVAKKEGVISIPSIQDNLDRANSYDGATGEFKQINESKAFDKVKGKLVSKNKKNRKIKFNLDDQDTQLSFNSIDNQTMEAILPSEDFITIPIPKTKKNILSYNNSIYLLDLESSQISPLLKDKTGAYNKAELKKKKIKQQINQSQEEGIEGNHDDDDDDDDDEEEEKLIWGDNPKLNIKGDKFSFYTNRHSVQSDELDNGGEIWLKDLATGEEKYLYSNVYEPLGWDDKDNLYVKDNNKVIRINTLTNQTEALNIDIDPLAVLSYPYLINDYNGALEVENVTTNEILSYAYDVDARINEIKTNEDSSYAAVSYYPVRSEPQIEIMIFNLTDMQIKFLKPPLNSTIVGYSWQDSVTLLLNTQVQGSVEEETYFVDINTID